MDRTLDEIANERQDNHAPRGPRRGNTRGHPRNDRSDYPRDGARKSYRDDERNFESEWVHDRYDNEDRSRAAPARRGRYSPEPRDRGYGGDAESSKLKVENIHYDLTEDDLDDLFNRIGPVEKLSLSYDRAGRSNGVAYVTYERAQDARKAIRDFDGANANGQPIRLSIISNSGPRARNPFDSAVRPPRPLADRITRAGGRSRSFSPLRHTDVSGPVPEGIDRYVPDGRSRVRSRSPLARRRDGRRPGARRERGDRAGGEERGTRAAPRPKKTQEELDAEMDDYWGSNKQNDNAPPAPLPTAAAAEGDIEMAD